MYIINRETQYFDIVFNWTYVLKISSQNTETETEEYTQHYFRIVSLDEC